jgi:hypothetical protein
VLALYRCDNCWPFFLLLILGLTGQALKLTVMRLGRACGAYDDMCSLTIKGLAEVVLVAKQRISGPYCLDTTVRAVATPPEAGASTRTAPHGSY